MQLGVKTRPPRSRDISVLSCLSRLWFSHTIILDFFFHLANDGERIQRTTPWDHVMGLLDKDDHGKWPRPPISWGPNTNQRFPFSWRLSWEYIGGSQTWVRYFCCMRWESFLRLTNNSFDSPIIELVKTPGRKRDAPKRTRAATAIANKTRAITAMTFDVCLSK